MSNKLQLRRDTAANWESANPVLAQGEVGAILDSKGKVVGQKIGDGVTEWKELPYDIATTLNEMFNGSATEIRYDSNSAEFDGTKLYPIKEVGEKLVEEANTNVRRGSFLIPIKVNDKLSIKARFNAYNLPMILDTNKTVLKVILKDNINEPNTPQDYTVHEEDAAFVAINHIGSSDYEITWVNVIVYRETKGLAEDIKELQKSNKPLSGKTIVCFGDSITELSDVTTQKRYSDCIAEITGANVVNVGIGGTQIRQRKYGNPTPYQNLDICKMVEAVCTQDFSAQITAANDIGEGRIDIVNRLIAVDFNMVNAVTIFAGTNDWYNVSQNGLGNSGEMPEDGGNITTLGGINYIIKKLLTTYPHLSIYWFSPIVRWRDSEVEGETGRTDNSWCDVFLNTEGKTLEDYVEAIKTEVTLNKIPFCDMYHTLGWNKYNFSRYFPDDDGTHPKQGGGFEFIGRKMAGFIIANKTF